MHYLNKFFKIDRQLSRQIQNEFVTVHKVIPAKNYIELKSMKIILHIFVYHLEHMWNVWNKIHQGNTKFEGKLVRQFFFKLLLCTCFTLKKKTSGLGLVHITLWFPDYKNDHSFYLSQLLDTNEWLQPSTSGSIPHGRGVHTATLVGDQLVLYGGSSDFDGETMQCQEYHGDVYLIAKGIVCDTFHPMINKIIVNC